MGGRGSGNWYSWSKKNTTGDLYSISIVKLKKWGCLKEGFYSGNIKWSWCDEERSSISYHCVISNKESYFRPIYTNSDTKQKYDYKIPLTATNPHYGGKRWWFRCPNCLKRSGVLYVGSSIFACRKCYSLAYKSQNYSYSDRCTDRAFKLAEELGLDGNCLDGFYGRKPKGMHWKTFNRKLALLKHYENQSWVGVADRMGLLES